MAAEVLDNYEKFLQYPARNSVRRAAAPIQVEPQALGFAGPSFIL